MCAYAPIARALPPRKPGPDRRVCARAAAERRRIQCERGPTAEESPHPHLLPSLARLTPSYHPLQVTLALPIEYGALNFFSVLGGLLFFREADHMAETQLHLLLFLLPSQLNLTGTYNYYHLL